MKNKNKLTEKYGGSTIKLNQYVVPTASVVCTEIDNSFVVLLKLDGTDFYTLNSTAAQIWKSAQEQKTVEEIIGDFIEQYDAHPSTIKESILRQVNEFNKEGLVDILDRKRKRIVK